ncbi:MAG: hypothetical protein MJZ95_06020, partial [Paludibacteraceae bacterium]|nr:hypothetical protein [Paludibacteraceae bacterium]
MKMEKEEIARRLKEASRKNEGVTIVVRTGQHETLEVPLSRSGVRRDATGEWYENWGLVERDPAAEGETRQRRERPASGTCGHGGEVWK